MLLRPRTVLLLLCSVLTINLSGTAQADVLSVDGPREGFSLKSAVQVLEDPGATMSAHEVLASPSDAFRPGDAVDRPNARWGRATESAFWTRLSLRNDSDGPLDLLLMLHRDDTLLEIDAYVFEDGGLQNEWSLGSAVPITSRPVLHRQPLVPLRLAPGETRTFLTRYRDNTVPAIAPEIWTRSEFRLDDTRSNALLWMFYGIMLVMSVYNAVLAVAFKDLTYLIYSVFIVSTSLFFFATIDGFGRLVLWDHPYLWTSLGYFCGVSLTMTSTGLFSARFLAARKFCPRSARFGEYLIWSYALLGVVSTSLDVLGRWDVAWVPRSLIGPTGPVAQCWGLLVCVGIVNVGYSAFVALRAGHRPARVFILAWTVIILSALVVIGWLNFDILPRTTLTVHAGHMGLALLVLLFSLALTQRVGDMRREVEDAQSSTIRMQEQTLHVEREAASTLQRKVDERTAQLAQEKAESDRQKEAAEKARAESDRQRRDAMKAQAKAEQEHLVATGARAEAEHLSFLAQASEQDALKAREESEQMRLQAEIVMAATNDAYELLERNDRQKTQFFQNISHELRTPLTLVINPLEDAALDHPEDDRIRLAERNARRLLRLVNQLLDFQKLSAGKKALQLENIDLVRFVWVCGDYIRGTCAGRDISLKVMVDGAEIREADLGKSPRFIEGEVDALEKIVFNYLSNALKYTPDGGEIRVELESDGEQLRLAVSDTGPGIARDDQSSLFQLFSQVDGSATREAEGTGLGLALVKELTEALQGHVGMESELGHGARFWSSFPSVAPPAEDSTEASLENFEVKSWLLADHSSKIEDDADESNEHMAGDGQRVLVVDDLVDMRNLIAGALRKHGYRVITARDAFEGLEKAQAKRPELIITDWMMPRKSGLDLIGELRADELLCHVPIVLLTARSDEEGKLLGTEVGADAFLGKPFNEQELCATVRNLLSLKEHERELEAAHKQLQEGVLKRYLPPDLVDAIVAGNQQMSVEPDQRAVTVLFADLQGFTSATQELRATKMASLLNEYLAAMTKVVFANGGTIDKFVGDAVMVVFGAPTEMKTRDQARRAVACGLAMQRAMQVLSDEWQQRGLPELQLRVGIHHGPAVVGNFGSEERLDYTVIGHTVNLASRVESCCEAGEVFVTPEVVDYLPEDTCEKRGDFELKGLKHEVTLYRVLPEAAEGLKEGEAAA